MTEKIQIKSIRCGNTGRFYAVGMDGTLYNIKSIEDMTFDFATKACYITDTNGNVFNLCGNQAMDLIRECKGRCYV